MEEGEAAMLEQLRLTCEKLRAAGFAVPEDAACPAVGSCGGCAGCGSSEGGAAAGTGASSAVSEEEQRRFLERMQPRQ